MTLTEDGARISQLEDGAKSKMGKKLVGGESITKYTTGAICYDTVAFTRFMLLSKKISPDDLLKKSGQAWLKVFKFDSGKQWKGKGMKAGDAVGFWRLADKKFFHASIATGNGKVRGVNGGKFGSGWSEADLNSVLGEMDEDGQFAFEGTKIKVWISKI